MLCMKAMEVKELVAALRYLNIALYVYKKGHTVEAPWYQENTAYE